MLLCKKIKLEVSDQDAATLEFMQSKCRGLYNWWVMKLRGGEKWNFAEAKRSLQESRKLDPELDQVYGKLLAEVFFRLDKAMKAFFRRLEAGEKPGFPRVRPRHCFFTLCYPAMYLKIEGNTLILPTGGKGKNKQYPNVEARLTELPPPDFREVAISRDARGNYYASFSYRTEPEPPQDGQVVAFDLGVKTLATGVNEQGRVYTIGGFKGSRWYNKQLDKIRSKRDKCKKKSRRYKHLSKVYNDWGLYPFLMLLAYKCLLYGKDLHFLDERNTSKMCSGCSHLQPMPLWKRTYCCTECGLVMDRDENSAHNILARFFARLGPHTQEECGVLQETDLEVASPGLASVGQVQQLELW
jgi:putative transposase